MFQVKVYTKPDIRKNIDARARCIFNEQMPFIPPKDAGICILDGYCVETIAYMYVDIYKSNNGLYDVEIHLTTADTFYEYPDVDWR
jgi:hypothetical protein